MTIPTEIPAVDRQPRLDVPYDSFLLVSFGGPEGPDDVMPFLRNVLRGKNVPESRMLEVAEHYQHFGGVSPINQQNRELLAAIKQQFNDDGIELPVYWGNRNWNPMFADTLRQMRDDGCRRSLAFFTSMFSCYSGCRQYREDLLRARQEVGQDAPGIEKLRMGFNHPGFVDTMTQSVLDAIAQLPSPTANEASPPKVLFTAHSIPMSMADHCDYQKQLQEASRIVAEKAGVADWELVYQSRSGPPQQPWLEPDVCDRIEELSGAGGVGSIVIVPIGFVSDHMEVMYDLDSEAADLCRQKGIAMARAKTAGTAKQFVQMISDLVRERMTDRMERPAVGTLPPWHDICPADCCQYTPQRPPAGRPQAQTEKSD